MFGLDTVEAPVFLMPGGGVEVLVQMPAVHYAQELHPPAYAEKGHVRAMASRINAISVASCSG